MSKAILVMEMPKECLNCRLCHMKNHNGYNDYICTPMGRIAPMAIGTDRPDWCPLREMPEYRRIDFHDGAYFTERKRGFNDCLREIEGSGEDGE